MKKFLVIIVVLILLIGASIVYLNRSNPRGIKSYTVEPITITAADGTKLGADYYPTDSERGLVLLHQLGKDRSSWGDLARKLQIQGFSVVALDLRGHGASKLNHPLTDADFNPGMIADVTAARQYLVDQGKGEQYLVGASIGANLALIDLASHGEDDPGPSSDLLAKPLKIVALSPGLLYHSLDADAAAQEIGGQLKDRHTFGYDTDPLALLVVAKDDPATKVADVQKLAHEIGGASAEVLTFDGSSHGTDLLKSQTDLEDQIIKFLDR